MVSATQSLRWHSWNFCGFLEEPTRPAGNACGVVLVLALSAMAEASAQLKASEAPGSVVLDPVVVTATVSPTKSTEAAASVTVIPRQQIEASQSRSVTELLRQVPGLHVDQAGGRGSVSSVYLRGGDPNFALVLIDGVKVNDPTNSRGGSFDFATLDVDNIERIEVVRGPLSAVYGSDAVSGVINIITRRGGDQSFRGVELAAGDSGYGRILMHAHDTHGQVDYAFSASNTDNGDPVEGSTFRGKAFNANVGRLLSDSTELRGTLRYADSHLESFPDDSGGPEFAVLRDVDKRDVDEFTLGTEYLHELSNRWDYRVRLGFYDRREDVRSPGVSPGVRDPVGIPPNTSDNRYRRTAVSVRSVLSLNERWRLAVGAEIESERGESDGSLLVGGASVPTSFRLRRNSWAPFIESRHRFASGLVLQAGVRIDRPEDFSSEISPRIGVSYTLPSDKVKLYANWGEGFKLPSFFALGNPIVGNQSLEPEVSRSGELGLQAPFNEGRVRADVVLFSNEVENAIDLAEGPPPALVNRSRITAQGVEIAVNATLRADVDVSAQLTYVETNIVGTQEELRNRPEWRAGLGVGWRPLPSVDVRFDILYVGEILDSSIPTGDRDLDSYTRVNVSTAWKPSVMWHYFLAVDNLFDADYEEAIGFPTPGVRVRAGVHATF